MDSSSSSENTPTPSRRRVIALILIATALILILVALIFALLTSAQPRFAFFTEDQFTQAQKAGPFTRLKYTLINLTASVLRPFHRHHPGILVSSSIVTRADDAPLPGQLGVPFATNATGMQAWILTPDEASAAMSQLKTQANSSSISRSRMQTDSGLPTSMIIGTRVQLPSGKWVALGNTLDLTATTTSASVNLVFDACSTEPDHSASNQLTVKTNFYVACRAFIPASSSLLINCGHTDPMSQNNYWLLLTPQLLDASGKPIRPR